TTNLPFLVCWCILIISVFTGRNVSQQYHLINVSLTWYDAQSFCRVKYTDLATVNNMDDKNKLVNTLGSNVTYCWIGLQKGKTHRWMWSDGRGTKTKLLKCSEVVKHYLTLVMFINLISCLTPADIAEEIPEIYFFCHLPVCLFRPAGWFAKVYVLPSNKLGEQSRIVQK
uniref:C-type lectin domain-containing protein n=1 Tax=Sander lucioperca TaxID=283035 RepID=A0A8C9WXV1_SANLU